MKESKTLRIGVIIVNYNAGEYLGKCIRSVTQSRAPLDIVIVDNDSLDDSLSSIKSLVSKPHRLKLIENPENYGFSRAVNQGALKLKNKYIMLLNPDCTVFPNTLLKLQQVMVSDRNIAVAGALVFNPDGSEQRGCRRNEPTLKRSIVTALGLGKRQEGIDQTYQHLPSKPVEVDAVSGAAMLVRREYFDQAGGLDEDYFLHCEDLDYCRRMRDYGYKVMFCPNASAIHRQGGSGGASSVFVEKHKHQGMLTYNRKHPQGNSIRFNKILITILVKGHLWIGAGVGFVRSLFKSVASPGKARKVVENNFSTLEITDSSKPLVVITGGKSDVGDFLLRKLAKSGYNCISVTRHATQAVDREKNINWLNLEYFVKSPTGDFDQVYAWINLAPIWTTRTLAKAFHKFKPARIIALSSTSIEGKSDSDDDADLEVVEKLIEGESWLNSYAKKYHICGAILRPTLIYGGPRNQNINFIESVIRVFRMFLIVGNGKAKRQPVHSEDVATACLKLLEQDSNIFRVYNIGGGEVLSYRKMVARIFEKLGKKERIYTVSPGFAKTVIKLVNWIPGLRFLGPEMANRMERDLVYSNSPAAKEFSFRPRKFEP
jgi:GT2 family glycosyltransferase/nucleoside-diphosphate-sugar epimerase